LVIWLNNDFYRMNEVFLPIVRQLDQQLQKSEELKKYQKEGNYFPAWERAYKEYEKQTEGIDIINQQKEFINEFFNLYRGSVVFVSLYDIPEEFQEIFNEKKALILNLKDFSENKDYYFEKIDSISPTGHQQLANTVYNFINNSFLSPN